MFLNSPLLIVTFPSAEILPPEILSTFASFVSIEIVLVLCISPVLFVTPLSKAK